MAEDVAVRWLWLGFALWAVLCAALVRGRGDGSWFRAFLWRLVYLQVLVLLLLPWGGFGEVPLSQRLVSDPVPLPPRPSSVSLLWLVLLFGLPFAVAWGARTLEAAQSVTERLPRGIPVLSASVLRAYGWFGLAPAVASAIPPAEWMPLPVYAPGRTAWWLVWCASLWLLGALLQTASRRPLSLGEAGSRAIAQVTLLTCWLGCLGPAVILARPESWLDAAEWYGISLAAGAALSLAMLRVLRSRLGMPREEWPGLRLPFRRSKPPVSDPPPAGA